MFTKNLIRRFRQFALGAICLVLAEFLLRLDLSRSFVVLVAVYAWILLCLLRINAARMIGFLDDEPGAIRLKSPLDWKIILRTIPRVLTGSGAY